LQEITPRKRSVFTQRQKKIGTHLATLGDEAGHRIVDLHQIGKVNQAVAGEQRPEGRGQGNADTLAQPLRQLCRVAVYRDCSERQAVEKKQGPTRGTTQSVCLIKNCVEHRCEIAG